MKYLLLPLYGNTENPPVTGHAPRSISHSGKAKRRLRFVFIVVWQFTERFKAKDSILNTSAIIAVTKSSIKKFLKFQRGLESIWRHFGAWLCLTNAVMLSVNIWRIYRWDIWARNPKSYWSLYVYSTAVLYDIYIYHRFECFAWYLHAQALGPQARGCMRIQSTI